VLRMVGQWMGKARKMAAEFQGQFQEAMREAEMADLKKSFDEVKEAATGFGGGNIMTSLQNDFGAALRIDDIDKPATTADAPATDAPVSAGDGVVTPITPEPPTAATFAEAETHAAASEPLAITPKIEQQPAPPDAAPASPDAPAAPDVLKDAKAS
jgi:sec-independent protein translocase protein TatB